MPSTWKQFTSLAVIFAILCLSLPASPAVAGWITTRDTVPGPKARLVSVLERDDVAQALVDLGVDRAEAIRRVSGLTDAEAQAAVDRFQSLPAGGDGAVGTIVFAALFVFIVLLVTDILGFTNVFPFVKKSVR